jgi:hypothetical protein
MLVEKLKRDAKAIVSNLKALPDDRLITTKPCCIYLPVHYEHCGLASIAVDKYVLGIFAITMGDEYCVYMVDAMVQIDPTHTNKVKIHGDEYYEFVFEAGATVIKNLNAVKTDTLVYLIFDQFFQKGNIPWFVGYEELGKIFDTAKKHAGTSIGDERPVTQLIASIVSRDPKDRNKSYRTAISSLDDLTHMPPNFIPLMGVTAATNTMTKLGGSYFSKGLVSALVNPAERPERIETILRK